MHGALRVDVPQVVVGREAMHLHCPLGELVSALVARRAADVREDEGERDVHLEEGELVESLRHTRAARDGRCAEAMLSGQTQATTWNR